MSRKNIIIISAILFGSVLGAWFFYPGKDISSPEQGKKLSIGPAEVFVRLADTDLTRTKGLSGTIPLKNNEGMLFIFDQPTVPRFWMKEMLYSLDIIWISPEKKIVSVEKNVSPETFPETFFPPSPVRYVLEVTGGFFEKNNLRPGDLVSW